MTEAGSHSKETTSTSQLNPTAPSFVPNIKSDISKTTKKNEPTHASDKRKNRNRRRGPKVREQETNTGTSVNSPPVQDDTSSKSSKKEPNSTRKPHKNSTKNDKTILSVVSLSPTVPSSSVEENSNLEAPLSQENIKKKRKPRSRKPKGRNNDSASRDLVDQELTAEVEKLPLLLSENFETEESTSPNKLDLSISSAVSKKRTGLQSKKSGLSSDRALMENSSTLNSSSNSKVPKKSQDDSISNRENSSRSFGSRLLAKAMHHLSNNYDVFHKSFIDSSAFIKVALKPTSPDFPYPLDRLQLQFQLHSKDNYRFPCELKVINPELPRNFAVNVEAALISRCYQEGSRSTLVANLEWLDSNLASILAQPEAFIIKFVRRNPTSNSNITSEPGVEPIPVPEPNKASTQVSSGPASLPDPIQQGSSKLVKTSVQTPGLFSTRRQKELILLKNRFRNSFKELSSSEFATQVQLVLETTDPEYSLQSECSSFTLKLTVPRGYPQESTSLEITPNLPAPNITESMLNNVREGFKNYAVQSSDKTIIHCLNWISYHIESLMKTSYGVKFSSDDSEVSYQTKTKDSFLTDATNTLFDSSSQKSTMVSNGDKLDSDSVKIEPLQTRTYSEEDSSASEAENDEDSDNENIGSHVLPLKTPHSGILLRAVDLDMKGVSLAHIVQLELEVACERCRVRLASPLLKPNNRSFFSCPQCNHSLGLQFRPTSLHLSSDSLGYVDTVGCTIFSLSRFNLLPTCANCLHSEALPQFNSVLLNSNCRDRCRTCHTQLLFQLQQVKFVRLAPTNILDSKFTATDSAVILGPSGIKKEKIVSKVGSPLPDFGACKHYKRSNRWLRFPCCGKAFPCDICHDKVSDHEQIYATAMVCGYCSSEMPYSDNFPACRRCEHTLTKSTRGKSFWEGGKGTRDPRRMNRNDSKKYAGLTKTISRAKQNKA